jgi:hypothetical protein
MPVSASELEGINDSRLNPPPRPTMQATSALRISRAASLMSSTVPVTGMSRKATRRYRLLALIMRALDVEHDVAA